MSKVEQRPVIGIVPTQVPDEDIVRVNGPDGLVEAIEVRDRTFMMGVQWHPEYFAGERSMGCIFKTLSMEASKALPRGAPSRGGLAYREARRWREMAEHSFCRLYLMFS